jgi:hypothetical protein
MRAYGYVSYFRAQKFPEFSPCPGGGHTTFQGGAIYANGNYGAVEIKIYDSTFESNGTGNVSKWLWACRIFIEISSMSRRATCNMFNEPLLC